MTTKRRLTFLLELAVWTGTQADGTWIEIAPENLAAAHEGCMREQAEHLGIDFDRLDPQHIRDARVYQRFYDAALAEVTDPDYWGPELEGWVPADEQVSEAPAGTKPAKAPPQAPSLKQ